MNNYFRRKLRAMNIGQDDNYDTVTGIPPLSLPNSKGKNLKSYSISGNVDESIIEYSDGTAIEGKPNLLRTLGRTEQTVSGNAQTKRILQCDKWAKLTANNNIGTPTNVVIGEGNVSFSVSPSSDGHGVAFPLKLKPNHSYTVYSDVATSNTAYKMDLRISFYAADGTWLSRQYSNAASSGKVLKSFAVPSNADMTVILCAKSIGTGANTPTLTFSDIMLVEGVYTTSNAPAYTPYKQLLTDYSGVGDKTKNLLHFSGRSYEEIPAGQTGNTQKRILAEDKFYTMTANNYGGSSKLTTYRYDGNSISFKSQGSGYGVAFPVKLNPNSTYTVSADVSGNSITTKLYNIRATYYMADGTWQGSMVLGNNVVNGRTICKFTVPENVETTLIVCCVSTGTGTLVETTFSNIMLVEGSYTSATMPTYEPYGYKIPVLSGSQNVQPTQNNIFINNSLFKTGENADTVNYPQNKTVKAVGKYVFTGTESIELYDNSKGFRFAVSDMETGNCIDGYCNRFENFKNVTDNDVPRVFFGYNNNYVYFRRFSETATTAEAIKATLADWYSSGKPLTIWYPLEEEVEEAVALPDIPTIQGNATIMIDTEVQPSEVSVEYAKE